VLAPLISFRPQSPNQADQVYYRNKVNVALTTFLRLGVVAITSVETAEPGEASRIAVQNSAGLTSITFIAKDGCRHGHFPAAHSRQPASQQSGIEAFCKTSFSLGADSRANEGAELISFRKAARFKYPNAPEAHLVHQSTSIQRMNG